MLSFGAPSSAPATSTLAGGFSFSATPNKSATGFGLGQPSAGSFGATSTTPALSFGTATSAAPAFGGIGATSSNFSSGWNTTTNTSTGLGFGAPISSAASTGLNLGVSAAPTLGGLNFGAPSSTSAPSIGLGLLGSTNTTAVSTPSLFGTKLNTTTTTTASSGGTTDQQPKQQKLPNEISGTVDSFTEFVKKQKLLGSDVMRVSVKPLVKVSQQAEETIRSALSVGGDAGRARAQARRLRGSTARALAAAEQAGRDSPDDGWRSLSYVQELLAELETQLMTCRRQTEAADRQMSAPHRPLTQQELSVGMRRMHESLVALAGRLQSVHAQVERYERNYQALRRHSGLEDKVSVGSLAEELGRKKSARANSSLSAVLSDPRAALGSLQQSTGPTPFTYLGSTLPVFPATDHSSGLSWPQPGSAAPASLPAPLAPSSSFQLQKPPKRGKQ